MNLELSRREFLKASGSLVVTFGAAGVSNLLLVDQAAAQASVAASPAPDNLDSWLAIAPDGKVRVFFGKVDHGQGLDTVMAQIVAEELDVPVGRVSVLMGDSARTANQGGASGSTGIRAGAHPIRNAAAEARRVVAANGARHLGVAPDAVSTADGFVFVTADPAKRVAYETLLGGKSFDTKLEWNKQVGNFMNATGQARPKPVSQYKVVGQSVPRSDVPAKILGTTEYVANVRVPGMLHARMIRPQVAAARPAKVDESSIASIPGAKVVWKKDLLAVVAEKEWDAIRASRMLKVEWTNPDARLPGHEKLHDHIRDARPVASNGQNAFLGKKEIVEQPTMGLLAGAAKLIEAEYEAPFQSHARMSPSVGVADVKDGRATIWTDTQKPHFQRMGLSKLLGMPESAIHVVWKDGAGSYGRSDADEAAYEAAFLSKELGRPVRVQWMRHEGIAWDPKAPAAVVTMKAALTADNKVNAWLYRAKGFSGWDVKFVGDAPEQTLPGQLLGYPKWNMHNFDTPSETYTFPNALAYWQTIAPLQEQASPLRCAHMRAPQEMQSRFAQECFVDEVAEATGQDPLAFRLANLKEEREIAVLKAAAEKAGWQPGTPARKQAGNVVAGRGIALHSGYGSYAAVVAEVEVNKQTGRVRTTKVVVAHDCGLIYNPAALKLTIEGNIMQGLSRALHEEVRFDERMVTSQDWSSYPIAEIRDVPDVVEIVTINRPDKPGGGAGEPATAILPAAVANAVSNAIGKRVRKYPVTAAVVKKTLSA